MNHKRLFRRYRGETDGLQGRQSQASDRPAHSDTGADGSQWSLEFVSDQFTYGRRLRVRTVVDDCTSECRAFVAYTSLSGLCVARELDRIIAERGKPRIIVNDNGSEFTSNAISQWADRIKVDLRYIAFGEPISNAFIESYNRRL